MKRLAMAANAMAKQERLIAASLANFPAAIATDVSCIC